MTVMNPSEDSFQNFINTSFHAHFGSFLTDDQWNYVWPVIVNMQTIGGLIGTLFVPYLTERWGRKKICYLTNGTFILTCLLQGIADLAGSWEVLTVGRLLSGIAQGVQQGLQPIYLNEISPVSKRGFIGSLTGFTLEFGFCLSSILALPQILGSESTWPYLFLIEAVPSVVALITLPFLYESPKFLASRGDFSGAERSLHFFGRTDKELKAEMEEIRGELAQDSSGAQTMPLKDIFTTPYIRKSILLGWLVIFSSIYSGIAALSYFSTSILEDSGVSPEDAQYGTIGMTGLCFIGALLGGLVLDRVGRRPIILAVNAAMLLWNVLFIVFGNLSRVHSIFWAADANVAVTAAIAFTFGLGPAAVVWLLTAELVPQRARSTAHAMAMIMQWVATGSAALLLYPLQKAINEFCFMVYVVPLAVSIVILAWKLPETKNKSTLEIMQQLGYYADEVEKMDDDVQKF